MKNIKKYGNHSIGTELDTFLRTNVMHETPSEEMLKRTKSEITKIVNSHFSKKTHHTFVEVWTVGNSFHCMIGFRPLEKDKFGFINCNVEASHEKQ